MTTQPANSSQPNMRVGGKVAIVTGGAGSIGFAIGRRLAEQGACVVLTDLHAKPVQAKAQILLDDGFQATGIEHDVRSPESWDTVVKQMLDQFGKLDVLVNAAGISARTGQPFDAIEFDDWRNVMSVNLDGVFIGMKAAVQVMKSRGGGSIINIASVAGFKGTAGGAAYGTSKGALRTLTKQAAFSCAEHRYNIRVNCIHPGYVWTALVKPNALRQYGDEASAIEALSRKNPLGKLCEPDDIAWAAVFLASDESRQMNGAEMVIDGGALLR